MEKMEVEKTKLETSDYITIVLQILTVILALVMYLFNNSYFRLIYAIILAIVTISVIIFANDYIVYVLLGNLVFKIILYITNKERGIFGLLLFIISYINIVIKMKNHIKKVNKNGTTTT